MEWVKLFGVFFFFIWLLNLCGMSKAMSTRAQWILAGICLALFLIAIYADSFG